MMFCDCVDLAWNGPEIGMENAIYFPSEERYLNNN